MKKPLDPRLIKVLLTIRGNCFTFTEQGIGRFAFTPREVRSLVCRMTAPDFHPNEREVERHLIELGFPDEVRPGLLVFYDLYPEPVRTA